MLCGFQLFMSRLACDKFSALIHSFSYEKYPCIITCIVIPFVVFVANPRLPWFFSWSHCKVHTWVEVRDLLATNATSCHFNKFYSKNKHEVGGVLYWYLWYSCLRHTLRWSIFSTANSPIHFANHLIDTSVGIMNPIASSHWFEICSSC